MDEQDDLIHSSFDAYADLAIDYDYFCPYCKSDDIRLWMPRD
jgi:hypothetical protein